MNRKPGRITTISPEHTNSVFCLLVENFKAVDNFKFVSHENTL